MILRKAHIGPAAGIVSAGKGRCCGHGPEEAGLGRFVRIENGALVGRAFIRSERQCEPLIYTSSHGNVSSRSAPLAVITAWVSSFMHSAPPSSPIRLSTQTTMLSSNTPS